MLPLADGAMPVTLATEAEMALAPSSSWARTTAGMRRREEKREFAYLIFSGRRVCISCIEKG